MAYVMIEGYLCGRCSYCWAPRGGAGFRPRKAPGRCPECNSPYWNTPRRNRTAPERRAAHWQARRERTERTERTEIPAGREPGTTDRRRAQAASPNGTGRNQRRRMGPPQEKENRN